MKGLGKVRNWVLDNYKEEIIIMYDDDIYQVAVNCNKETYFEKDPDKIRAKIISAAVCGKDIGTSVFGFSQAEDCRKYDRRNPFLLNNWVGGVIGIIGRKHRFYDDNMLRVDIDFCLQTLLKERILWIDNRLCFKQLRETNRGGNSEWRTSELLEIEQDRIKRKWGKYYKLKKKKTTYTTSINVQRTI